MARVKNVIKKAESMSGKIPSGYQLDVSQIVELYEAFSFGWFSLIVNSFRFGYLQGMKATKAEMKRGANKWLEDI
ncbi:MAG: hypothetical protein ACOYBE_00630 [Blautia sp.]